MFTQEEGQEEVCLIDTIVEEQCEQQQLQAELIEELAELPEKLNEPSDLCVIFVLGERKKKFSPY